VKYGEEMGKEKEKKGVRRKEGNCQNIFGK
jgi:hypothetical protein